MAWRDLCRRLPGGWRSFRRLEGWYAAAPNNAVVGSKAGGEFMGRLLEGMLAVPPERQLVRFALGTHLLQQQVASYLGETQKACFSSGVDDVRVQGGLAVYSAPYFYPVGPEISQHWFREGGAADAEAMIEERTHVIHWYASVRTREVVPKITPDFVAERAGSLAFCKLAQPYL